MKLSSCSPIATWNCNWWLCIWLFDSTPYQLQRRICVFYTVCFGVTRISLIKTIIMGKWEKELETNFLLSQWIMAFTNVQQALRSLAHWEQYLKMVYRWYRTPPKLLKMYLECSSLCWRNCDEIGSISHFVELLDIKSSLAKYFMLSSLIKKHAFS